jgi:hypothetical protein
LSTSLVYGVDGVGITKRQVIWPDPYNVAILLMQPNKRMREMQIPKVVGFPKVGDRGEGRTGVLGKWVQVAIVNNVYQSQEADHG